MMKLRTRTTRLGVIVGVALLALTGCSTDNTSNTNGSKETPAAQHTRGNSVVIENAWVKTADSGGMTAAFGTLTNASDTDMTVVSVTSSASAAVELHETTADSSGQMVMREVPGGFVVPAREHLRLEPGGNHLMLMDLPSPIKAGEEVEFTLIFSDGSTLKFTATAKDYAGANETYEGGTGHGAADQSDDAHSGH